MLNSFFHSPTQSSISSFEEIVIQPQPAGGTWPLMNTFSGDRHTWLCHSWTPFSGDSPRARSRATSHYVFNKVCNPDVAVYKINSILEIEPESPSEEVHVLKSQC